MSEYNRPYEVVQEMYLDKLMETVNECCRKKHYTPLGAPFIAPYDASGHPFWHQAIIRPVELCK